MSPKFFFECTLGLFATVDLLATVRLFVLMRAMPRRFIWRLIIVLWGAGAMGFCVLIIVANPLVSGLSDPLPRWLTAGAFIWHFLVLPVLVVGLLFDGVVRLIGRVIGWVRPVAEKKVEVEGQPVMVTDPILDLSRRRFLASAALMAAPVATGAMVGAGLWQLGRFRIREFDLAIAGWPKELDNYSMTVIADVHVGEFSTPDMLENIVHETNRLKSDLVLLPGDLINMSHSDLPGALDMVQRLEARDGVYMIEGNHDVIQGADLFDYKVRRRGINLLVDEAVTIRTRRVAVSVAGDAVVRYVVSEGVDCVYGGLEGAGLVSDFDGASSG